MNTKLQLFINTNPKVKAWAERLARKSTATKQVFTSNLFVYWQSSLSKSFKSLGDWEAKVSEQARDTENDTRTTWARDLEEYVLSRVASKTKRPMSKPARAVSFAAIKSYLTFRLGDTLPKYKPIFTVSSEDIAHAMEKGHDTTTVTLDEAKRLVLEAKTKRDRAIILSSMWGWGVGEFIEFSKYWYNYVDQIRARNAPIKVELVRAKSKVRFYTMIWDDGVDSLADLLEERERDLGRKITGNDALFVDQDGSPVTAGIVQKQIRRLAISSGIEQAHTETEKGQSYRVRFHELGRDLFATTCNLRDVPEGIYNFCMGHKTDPLGYVKTAWTPAGEAKMKVELLKVRGLLNVLTGRGKVVERGVGQLDQQVESLALLNGIDFETAMKEAMYHISKLPLFQKAIEERVKKGTIHMEGVLEEMLAGLPNTIGFDNALETAKSLPYEQVRPGLIAWAKARSPTMSKKVQQKVIGEGELQKYLDDGWTFRSSVNSVSVLVEKEIE